MYETPFKDFHKYLSSYGFAYMDRTNYGPPYIPNDLLEQTFIEEICGTQTPSSLSIHECLEAKIDPNIKNESDMNNRPLHYAAKYGNVSLAKMLIRAGADIHLANRNGETPLLVASRGTKKRHGHFVKMILFYGANVNVIDRGGITALSHAVVVSNPWTVHELLLQGANLANTNRESRHIFTTSKKSDKRNIVDHAKQIKMKSCGGSSDLTSMNKCYRHKKRIALGVVFLSKERTQRLLCPCCRIVHMLEIASRHTP